MADQRDRHVREKLLSRGAEALSDAELLSVVLGDCAPASSLDMAEKVLDGRGFAALTGMDIPTLRAVAGMGVRRAAVLSAAFELGARLNRERAMGRRSVNSDEDVAHLFRPLLADLRHEELWVAYLAPGNRVVEKARISSGWVNGTVVDHKLIVKRAVELLSPALVVVHNHPSGAARPSDSDLELTLRIKRAAALFDIALLDHVIITPESHFSFRSNGLLDGGEGAREGK